MRRDATVVIVGGGPAGASTAFQLARRGVDVLVLDRARFPRGKACAECLSPQASRLLHEMGVLHVLEPRAARLRGMMLRSPGGAIAHGSYRADHGYRGFRDVGLSIRREVLDATLLGAAASAGARVREGVRVVDVERAGRGVTGVRVADDAGGERVVRASIVVGADGLRSVVARRLGLSRHARWPRRLAIVAHYHGVRDVVDEVELHVEHDGFVGIADVSGGVTTVAAVFPLSRAGEIARAGAGEFLRQWLSRGPHLAPRFTAAVSDGPVRVTGPFASHSRRAWAPGALLVGDAADFFDPFTGEGVYAALRGGELAASAIEGMLAGDRAAGSAYDAARRAEFGGKWAVEQLVGIGVAVPAVMNRAARALAARPHLADLLAGVTGDFVPARHVLSPGFLARLLLLPPWMARHPRQAAAHAT